MIELQHPYPRVVKGGAESYGGSQQWAYRADLRKCGCGPVAALDLALYLCRFHGGGGKRLAGLREAQPIPLADYNAALTRLCPAYFPLIPPFGINHGVLALGLDRLLRDEGIPYRAHVSLATEKLWSRMEAGLRADTPVLLAIGQNFPQVWGKHRLPFYARRGDGSLFPAAAAKAHFVAVTGMDESWLRISSWGREYYVNRDEFSRYVKQHSGSALSGLVCAVRRPGT